jgi:hypothetical protein
LQRPTVPRALVDSALVVGPQRSALVARCEPPPICAFKATKEKAAGFLLQLAGIARSRVSCGCQPLNIKNSDLREARD